VVFPPTAVTTRHTLHGRDGALAYDATADWIAIRRVLQPVAHVFCTLYRVDHPESHHRPLTFVFNGGPGAASAYLHLGAMGPVRVEFGAMGDLPPSPARTVDNLDTWLAFTDLVFVDPVGTGFSRAFAGNSHDDPNCPESDEFWEIEKDLESLVEVIRQVLSTHHRWMSPVFIAGESYGAFRAAKMAGRLQQDVGAGLCGILLISPGIEFDALKGSDYDLTHWIELFPSLVAAAHHHGRSRNVPPDVPLETLLSEAEGLALNDLTRWLAQGQRLPAAERSRLSERMSELTGTPKDVIERAGGRISASLLCRTLLAHEGRICSQLDVSMTAANPFPDRAGHEGPDPTMFAVERLFASAINHHLRRVLQVDTELDYRVFSLDANKAWAAHKGRRNVFRKIEGATDDLRYAMSANQHLKVLIAHGVLDLVTPYFSSARRVPLMKLAPAQAANLTVRTYRGGHMFYCWNEARNRLHADVSEFYTDAIAAGARR
jgi:carboxypeptidase C (cathepsin A)